MPKEKEIRHLPNVFKSNDKPMPFLSMSVTRSASVRYIGLEVSPSRSSHIVGSNSSPSLKSGI